MALLVNHAAYTFLKVNTDMPDVSPHAVFRIHESMGKKG